MRLAFVMTSLKALAVAHQPPKAMRYAALTHPTQAFGLIKSTILSRVLATAPTSFQNSAPEKMECDGYDILRGRAEGKGKKQKAKVKATLDLIWIYSNL